MQKNDRLSNDLAYRKKLREYIIKASLSEVSKIIIFLAFAVYFNLTKEYFIALFFLMLLRNVGGGLHFQHYVSCLFVSFFFIYASIIFAFIWQPNRIILLLSLLICVVIGYKLVPITSLNRPPATEQQVKHSKQNTVLIISALFLIICICPLNLYLYIGFWTTILHIFQLTIAHMIKGGN